MPVLQGSVLSGAFWPTGINKPLLMCRSVEFATQVLEITGMCLDWYTPCSPTLTAESYSSWLHSSLSSSIFKFTVATQQEAFPAST